MPGAVTERSRYRQAGKQLSKRCHATTKRICSERYVTIVWPSNLNNCVLVVATAATGKDWPCDDEGVRLIIRKETLG